MRHYLIKDGRSIHRLYIDYLKLFELFFSSFLNNKAHQIDSYDTFDAHIDDWGIVGLGE